MTSSQDDEAGTTHGSSSYGSSSYDSSSYDSSSYGGTPPSTVPQHAQQQQYDQQSYGQPAYGQHSYAPPQQQSYGPAGYGQQSYAQPQYAQPQYGQPQYGQQQYGQQQYAPTPEYAAQPQYGGQPQYGQPYGQQGATAYGQQAAGGYGGLDAGAGSRPGGLVTAAVLGFLLGAVGALATIVLFFAGAIVGGASSSSDIPGLRSLGGGITGVIVVSALLALAWTIVMIWGSVWALTGRTRVMLLVGGSIALALTAFSFFGALADVGNNEASSVVWPLVFFLASLAVVVLLSVPAAGRWFAARRALRGR